MMQNLLKNWKTTSAGLIMIIGDTVHLVFAIANHQATEGVWTGSLVGLVGGLGLLLAGDASRSQQQVQEAKADLKKDVKTAIDTGNTDILKKTEIETKG
jgi:hypothetical protein